MPYYNLEELRKKTFYRDVRKFELKSNNDPTKIWIPDNRPFYQVIHYNVRLVFPNSRWAGMECFKYDYQKKIKGCPICEKIDELWAIWRDVAKKSDPASKETKKQVQNKINMLKNEYFWLNIIHLDDPDRKFQLHRFTPACMEEIQRVDEKYNIRFVIWNYRKIEKDRNTKYQLSELLEGQEKILKELNDNYDELRNRPYEMGGWIDAEKAVSRNFTLDEYLAILHGEEIEETTEPKHLEDKKSEIEISDSSLTLDQLDSDVEKTDKKEDKIDDDLLNLDSLELAPLEEEKFIEIDSKMVNEKRNDKIFINKLAHYLMLKKAIGNSQNYKDKVIACFNYVKNNGTLKVNEQEWNDIVPF